MTYIAKLNITFPLISLYLFGYAAYGILLPFLPLVLKNRGLSDSDISFALASFGIAALVAPIISGFLADKHFSANKILAVSLLIAGCLVPILNLADSGLSALLCLICFYLFFIPFMTLVDQYTLALVKPENMKLKFQHFRSLGSLGFMLPSLSLALFGWNKDLPYELFLMAISTHPGTGINFRFCGLEGTVISNT